MTNNNKDISNIAKHYEDIITSLGEDISREGLQKTPLRVAQSLSYLTRGYQLDPVSIIREATFEADPRKGMIVVSDIEVYSLCEHHMLPFFGKAHVGYYPNEKIVGLSKIPRFIEALSSRLQVQENLTAQILESFQEALNPKGIAVALECTHLCLSMRGVKQQNSITKTSCFTGVFEELKQQELFFHNIKK